MTMIPRCSRCDAPIDPYGRDGGHAWCRACLDEADAADARKRTEELKAKVRRAA